MKVKVGDYIIPNKQFYKYCPSLKSGIRQVKEVSDVAVLVDKPFKGAYLMMYISHEHYIKYHKTKLFELLFLNG